MISHCALCLCPELLWFLTGSCKHVLWQIFVCQNVLPPRCRLLAVPVPASGRSFRASCSSHVQHLVFQNNRTVILQIHENKWWQIEGTFSTLYVVHSTYFSTRCTEDKHFACYGDIRVGCNWSLLHYCLLERLSNVSLGQPVPFCLESDSTRIHIDF